MSENPASSQFTEYRAPAYLYGLALFCLLFTPLLAAISFMAWWVEDAAIGLWTMPIWLGMAVYWFWQWRIWAQRMRVYADRLEILMPLAERKIIDYTQITALNMGQGMLHVSTKQAYAPIRGDANTLALMAAALEEVVPALRAARDLPPSLPIVVKAQRQSILIMSVFGLLIAALGVGLTNAAIDDVEMQSRGFAIGFGIVMIGMGGMLLYWLFVTFVWRYRFDKDWIEARHTFHSERYQPALLRQIEMKQQTVTNRGITRILYTLEIHFADDQKLLIQPGAQNYPFEYAEAHEKILLEKLLAQLTSAYPIEMQQDESAMTPTEKATQPVSRSELDPNNLPWNDVEAPEYGWQLHSAASNFSVFVLNYGERQPGAETLQIRLSRPVEGEERFDTTNGNALFSPNGKWLLLHDSFLPIVIDTAILRAWHYTIAERTFLLNPRWDGEKLVGKTLGYGKRVADAEEWGPWSWEEIITQWQPGLGKWSELHRLRTSTSATPAATSRPRQTRPRQSRNSATNRTPPNLPPGISEHLWRKLNFIELNPDWVMLGDGTIFAAKPDYVLPRQIGEHVIGGEIQMLDEPIPRPAAFVMDSTLGGVAAVYVKRNDQWQRVVEAVDWMRPYVNFAGFDHL